MTGKLEWLNVSTAMWSRWTEAESMFLDLSEEVSFTSTEGRDICIHEIDHSGSVLLSSVDREPRPLMGYGDTAVYVTIDFASGWDQELSGPVHTPIRVDGVETLRLNLRVPRGNQALTSVDYMVAVNAHCIFERLSEHGF